jgi:hypothetical protein
MLNLDPVCLSLISMILGLLGGVITTIFTGREMVKHNERRNALLNPKKVFFNLRLKVELKEIPANITMSTFCEQNISISNEAIRIILFHIGKRKGMKISRAYNEYKSPYTNHSSERITDSDFIVYNFDESTMKEAFDGDPKFKTGKDLLLHNLQTIINLTK